MPYLMEVDKLRWCSGFHVYICSRPNLRQTNKALHKTAVCCASDVCCALSVGGWSQDDSDTRHLNPHQRCRNSHSPSVSTLNCHTTGSGNELDGWTLDDWMHTPKNEENPFLRKPKNFIDCKLQSWEFSGSLGISLFVCPEKSQSVARDCPKEQP